MNILFTYINKFIETIRKYKKIKENFNELRTYNKTNF